MTHLQTSASSTDPIGCYRISDQGEVTGRIAVDGVSPWVIILVGDTVIHVVETHDHHDPERGRERRFTWAMPDIVMARGHALSIIHAESGRRLEGPTSFDSMAKPRVGGASAWRSGVAGDLSRGLNQIADGLYVDVGLNAVEPRFCRADGPDPVAEGTPALRLTATEPAPWSVHCAITPGLCEHDESALVRIWMRLTTATTPLCQSHCEFDLCRWNGQRFVKIRRLRKGRILRRYAFHDLKLELEPDERQQLISGLLFLSVRVQPREGIEIHPPHPAPAPLQDDRFEDGRLAATFRDADRLARLSEPSQTKPVSGRTSLARASGAPATDIIIPVFNGGDGVAQCLGSIRDNTTTPFSVIMMDDGSRPYTTALLERFAAQDDRFRLYRRDYNRGYTKSVNEALKRALGDWVVVLNSDTFVTNDWLAKLHRAAAAVPGAGMVGPLSNAATWQSIPEFRQVDGRWAANDFITPANIDLVRDRVEAVSTRDYPCVPLLNGFCTLISREVLDKVGLLDEDAFPIGYGEETDLCLRAVEAGFKLVIADDCFVYHAKSRTFGARTRSELSRRGGMELRNKHLGVNIGHLETQMLRNPTLSRLREGLKDLRLELGAR